MSLPNYLSRIKSAGVYRYVFDKSIIPTDQESTLRLVVGYSEQGPFNTPVYVNDAAEFIQLFGNISRRMEKRGIFFHRLAIQALDRGPILVLNIKPFNAGEEPEKSSIFSFSGSDLRDSLASIKGGTCVVAATTRGQRDTGVISIYDTNRFWKVDASRLHDIRISGTPDRSGYIRVVQTSTKEDSTTIFYRPIVPAGYAVKISDWYSNAGEDIPTYLESIKDRYLDEYFAEAYVFKGNMAKEDLFKYTGSLGASLPCQFIYARDEDGDLIYWDVPTAQEIAAAGADPVKIEELGKKYYQKPVLESIKTYRAGRPEEFLITKKTVGEPEGWSEMAPRKGKKFYTLTLNGEGVAEWNKHTNNPVPAQPSSEHEAALAWQKFCIVEDGKVRINPGYLNAYGEHGDALDDMAAVSTSNFLGHYTGTLLPNFKDSIGNYISLDLVFNLDYNNHKCLMSFNELLLDEIAEADLNADGDYADKGEEFSKARMRIDAEILKISAKITELEGKIAAAGTPADDKAKKALEEHKAKKVDLEEQKKQLHDDKKVSPYLSLICSALGVGHLTGEELRAAIDQYTHTYPTGLYLEGYEYRSISRVDNGRALQDKIFGVLSYKGIREALTNNIDVDYHYIVDTFQTYPGYGMKSQLTGIAMAKDNSLAILNFPTLDAIMRHCGHSRYDGGFEMKELTRMQNGISLPSETQGASWCAFYTQVILQEGAVKHTIPSAALVSNLFIDKWQNRLPYYIVAGPNHGRIDVRGLVGPDYSYARKDLDVLEPFGVNAIVHIPRYGTVINSNQTAKQTPVSALSKVHVRELVIFLQNEIEYMLRGYQWELNTQELREKIKAKADVILGLIQANGGVYDFRTKCDSENNTPEVIDNEMVILDVDIEPARGAGKMVQRLSIYRTGGIASSPRN